MGGPPMPQQERSFETTSIENQKSLVRNREGAKRDAKEYIFSCFFASSRLMIVDMGIGHYFSDSQ
jgi:hypothetical protein